MSGSAFGHSVMNRTVFTGLRIVGSMPAYATSEEEFLNLRMSPISASILAADIGVMLGIV